MTEEASTNFGLTQRKKSRSPEDSPEKEPEVVDISRSSNEDEPNLNLVEEVFLLGLKDKQGYTSFWNDCLSIGLRGCILVELAFRNRVELEKDPLNKKRLTARKLVLKSDAPIGDVLLDQALKLIKESYSLETVSNWIEHLSGDSWNPFKYCYHLKNVRERLSKNLMEKGVLTTGKLSYFLFDLTTYPLVDVGTKKRLMKKLQDEVVKKWVNDYSRMDKWTLALILLAHASDVLENALRSLKDADYEVAKRRVKCLLELNFEQEVRKSEELEVLWAVMTVFLK